MSTTAVREASMLPKRYKGRVTFRLDEVTEILGLSMNSLRRSIAAGEIHTIRISARRRVISRTELMRILTEGLGS